ncbi:MAG: PQQ-binding-like beta-propeller repeat protein [Pirellulaceae bacterium]
MIKLTLSTICVLTCGLAAMQSVSADWWSFRGTGGTSSADAGAVPVEMTEEKNLAWKTEMPGRGPSGPLVIGDRVVVTCSSGDKQDQLYVVCVDANSGDEIWQRRFWATGRCFCHPLSANAAPTPCTDGEYIYAFYSSSDLICLDLDGNLKWCRGLGVDHPKAFHDTGMSSSPAVFGDVVVCQVENQGDSFATGIDRHTGKTLWEIPRDADASWASPLIFNTGDGARPLCLLTSGSRATVVDVATGETVWEKEGRGNPIPSAAVVENRLFVPIDGTTAVDFDSQGNFSEVWNSSRIAPGSPSNVVHNNSIYSIGRGGVLSCADTGSGERVWQARVGGQHWTTPLVANDHMYLFAQDGNVSVVQLSGDFEDHNDRIVHTHEFADEVFLGSPAATDGAIYMRSDKYLYKFATDPARGMP